MIGGNQLYLYEGDPGHVPMTRGYQLSLQMLGGHLPMLGDISYTNVGGTFTNVRGYQLYSCEGNMYQ